MNHYRCRSKAIMRKAASFFFVVSSISLISSTSAAGAIKCASGWLQENGDSYKDVSPEKINDGYCDCPLDGLDEPKTGACAGSMDGGWSGVKPSIDVTQSRTGRFACRQQKALLLPLSRADDGVCDCCDGSDEPPSSNCKDECGLILAEERAARAKITMTFAEGSKRRSDEMAEYQQLLRETVDDIEELRFKKMPETRTQLNKVKENMMDMKRKYAIHRLGVARDTYGNLSNGGNTAGFFETMTFNDIKQFIISSCQLAGELVDADTSGADWKRQMTCMPLRLAGLDIGVVWKNENIAEGSAVTVKQLKEEDENDMVELGGLLRLTQADGEGLYLDPSTTLKKKPIENQEHMLDYDHFDDDDYEDHHHEMEDYDDDDFLKNHRSEIKKQREKRTRQIQANKERKSDESNPEVESAILSSAKSTPFYLPRSTFKPRAEALILSIDSMLGLDEDNAVEGEENDAVNQLNIDPMAIQMARGTLSRRLSHIERGEYFASSAVILLDSLQQAMEATEEDQTSALFTMKQLALGTLNYGNIGSEDVAEILYSLIPDYRMSDDHDNACTSHFASLCPPRSQSVTSSSGLSVTYPPSFIITAAEARCEQRDLSSQVCFDVKSDEQTDIPTSIPDGYYNYFVHQSRSEDDYLTESFRPLDFSMTIAELEIEQIALETEISELERNLQDLEGKIGGGDSPKYGADGELYGIRDDCVSLEAGKYEYGVCFFQGATQKEIGSHSSTDLGKWEGMEIHKETGLRVMKWTNGAKCWNGPKRSIEASVTCGRETKILTADEPDTCRYVLAMESHIACDDRFKLQNDL